MLSIYLFFYLLLQTPMVLFHCLATVYEYLQSLALFLRSWPQSGKGKAASSGEQFKHVEKRPNCLPTVETTHDEKIHQTTGAVKDDYCHVITLLTSHLSRSTLKPTDYSSRLFQMQRVSLTVPKIHCVLLWRVSLRFFFFFFVLKKQK